MHRGVRVLVRSEEMSRRCYSQDTEGEARIMTLALLEVLMWLALPRTVLAIHLGTDLGGAFLVFRLLGGGVLIVTMGGNRGAIEFDNDGRVVFQTTPNR